MSLTKTDCEKCGAPVEAGARFCIRCGADVSSQQGEVATRHIEAVDRSATQIKQNKMMESLRHATLGEYEILAELGRGGMATVFLAHDLALDRKVAIKMMSPHLLEGEGMIERFKLEARTAAALSHPHIIPIYAVKETEHVLYFVMKFIEGRALDSIIKQIGPLPIPMVKDILTKVGQALGYAHRRGVVHRDVKPGNIMIDEEGTPIVTDFGIAKVAQTRGLTMTGATIGTPSYMSPEQCAALEVTGASDQYSLGIVAYEMLTGSVPFNAETIVSIMYKHCHDEAPAVELKRPDAPPEVREVVSKMLAKDAAARWPSLEAAAQGLGAEATLAFDDPFKTQLGALAKEGSHRDLLARISTPKSPIPKLRTEVGQKTKRSIAGAPGAHTTRPSSPTVVTQTRAAGRSKMMIGVVVTLLVAAAGGAWFVLKPGAGATANPPVASAPSNPSAQTDPGATTTNPSAVTTPPVTSPAAEATVASLQFTNAPSAPLTAGQTMRLTVRVRDGGGNDLRDRKLDWRSNNPTVASVSANGTVTATAGRGGEAQIIVTADGVSATAVIAVTPAANTAPPPTTPVVETVASITVNGDGTLLVDQTTRMTAQVRSQTGGELTRDVAWSSSDRSVATVNADGVVRAVGAGAAQITASVDGRSGSTSVTVTAPVVAPPPVVATPTPSPAETRAAIEKAVADVIQNYATALESRDIARVRLVYSRISATQEQQLRAFFGSVSDLKANLRIGDVTPESDGRWTTRVTGTYNFQNTTGPRQRSTAPVTFDATFERVGDVWRLVQTR